MIVGAFEGKEKGRYQVIIGITRKDRRGGPNYERARKCLFMR